MSAYEDFIESTEPVIWWKTDNVGTTSLANYGTAGTAVACGLLGGGWDQGQPSIVPSDSSGKSLRLGNGGSGGFGSNDLGTAFHFTSFSAQVWVKPESLKDVNGGNDPIIMAHDLDGANHVLRWRCYINNDGQLVVLYRTAASAVVGYGSGVTNLLEANALYLVGLTFDGTKFQFWVNGAKFGAPHTPVSLYPTTNGRLEVGCIYGAFATSPLKGSVQHFMYHNGVLSDDTMTMMYARGLEDVELGLTRKRFYFLSTDPLGDGYPAPGHNVNTGVADSVFNHAMIGPSVAGHAGHGTIDLGGINEPGANPNVVGVGISDQSLPVGEFDIKLKMVQHVRLNSGAVPYMRAEIRSADGATTKYVLFDGRLDASGLYTTPADYVNQVVAFETPLAVHAIIEPNDRLVVSRAIYYPGGVGSYNKLGYWTDKHASDLERDLSTADVSHGDVALRNWLDLRMYSTEVPSTGPNMYLGSSKVSKLYLGSNEVSATFLGASPI